MTRVFSSGAEAQAQQLYQEASPWIERLARLGYAAKGVAYCIIGALAVQTAIGEGGRTTDTKGALQTLLQQPFGYGLVSVMALGLLGYSLWRFVQAFKDPEQNGSDVTGMGKRAGYCISGVIHAGLSAVAIGMLVGSSQGGQGDKTQDWTAWLMSLPWGVVLVGLIGAGILAFGFYQIYRAWTVRLDEELVLSHMGWRAQQWTIRFGRFGLAARGVVFGLIGASLIVAAVYTNPHEAQGLGDALRALHERPYGPWLLGGVALGLIAYGLYQLITARYRRIRPA